MDTRDLQYLLEVADQGGLGRAVEALGISQPALSKAIQRVEQQVGARLFERTSRGMRPSEAGQRFIERARRICLEYQDALLEMHELDSGQQGLLRLGYSPTMPEEAILDACRRLIRERPKAQLRLVKRFALELLDSLLAGELDLLLAPLPETGMDGTDGRRLFDDRLLVVADAEHPLLQRRQLKLADICSAQWLLPGPRFSIRQYVERAFRLQGLPLPQARVEVDFGTPTLFQLIAGTRILCIATEETLQSRMLEGMRVLDLAPGQLDLRREVGLIVRSGAYLSPVAERMIEILRGRLGQATPP